MLDALALYEAGLGTGALSARVDGDRATALPVTRWLAPASAVDRRVLARAVGPVLDVGCGPGRHVHALARRGVLAAGVDISPTAVALTRRGGAAAIHASVFDRLPGAGTWKTALLLDGNVGIGGRPVALLARVARLLAPCGIVLCELDPARGGQRAERMRLEVEDAVSDWFDWARVGREAIADVAAGAGLRVHARVARRRARVRGVAPMRRLRLPADPPPGPTDPRFWKSPIRGSLLTSLLGLALLCTLPIVALTGFLSHAAYDPQLGANNIVPGAPDLLPGDWPTSPSWLYALTQGLHVSGGMIVVPLLLVKLWSVIPRLFEWPPVRSPMHALERLSLLALVGGVAFQFVTGILNSQLYYPWKFNFVVAHYWGAWVFVGALITHVLVKLPTMRRSLATRREIGLGATPEPYVPGGLAPRHAAEPTITRRGVLALAGTASGALFVAVAGQSIGGPLRTLSVLAPRNGRLFGDGPNSFAVNKTAAVAKVTEEMTGPAWRLVLGEERELSREELLALPQTTASLPIACVEGWSTTQSWTGVPLRDLARLAGAPEGANLRVESLQPRGAFRATTLSADAVADERSLLALRVNGADLSLDHGYPARIIVPALPGVHNTKWVASLRWV